MPSYESEGHETRAQDLPVAAVDAASRGRFIVQTYVHLLAAIAGFVLLEAVLFASGVALQLAEWAFAGGRLGWLVVLGAFLGVSWLAERWASGDGSRAMQYAGLGLYVVAEALIFAPLLVMAAVAAGDASLIGKAAWITLALFGGLTGVVFVTRKDFSFLRGVLLFGAVGAIAFLVIALLMGLTIGTFFAWLMLLLAGGYTLYHTSNVLHHYRTDQYVAAALSLFATIALMYWYVLRILMSRR